MSLNQLIGNSTKKRVISAHIEQATKLGYMKRAIIKKSNYKTKGKTHIAQTIFEDFRPEFGRSDPYKERYKLTTKLHDSKITHKKN